MTDPSPPVSGNEITEAMLDSATPLQIARANAAVQANLNADGSPKYDSAQGYACALTAIIQSDLAKPASPEPSDAVVERVARALCRVTGADPDALGVDGNPRWKGWAQYARPAIAALPPHVCPAVEAAEFAHRTLVDFKIARHLTVDGAGGAAAAVSKAVTKLRLALKACAALPPHVCPAVEALEEAGNRLFDIYIRRLMSEGHIDLERANKDRGLFADALVEVLKAHAEGCGR